VISTVGLMARANAEIRAAQQNHEAEKAHRSRLGRPIAFIDRLINDLEMLNLKGGLRVPASLEARLEQLRVLLTDIAVPSANLEKLRTRILIVNLMDQLYAIEESLFRHHRPDRWEEADVTSKCWSGPEVDSHPQLKGAMVRGRQPMYLSGSSVPAGPLASGGGEGIGCGSSLGEPA